MLHIALRIQYEHLAALVGQQGDVALGVVAHAAHFVVEGRVRTLYQEPALYGVFQNFQLLQSATDGRLPHHAVVHLKTGIHGVGEVPGVAGVVVEILYFVGLAVVVAIAAVVHASPYYTQGLAKLGTSARKLWGWNTLAEEFDVTRLGIQTVGSVA